VCELEPQKDWYQNVSLGDRLKVESLKSACAVRSPEQREQEQRAKLENKIVKYRTKREAGWQALGRPRPSSTPLYDQFTERHAENRSRLRPLYGA
jgi:hypothetical protein